ncbi:MAG: lycopene cyclase domain-containing protein [Bacteroidales bacterium]
MEKWTYALLLAGSIAIPLLRSFEPRIRFFRYRTPLFAGIGTMMLVYIPWDIIFTQRGIWSFNHDYVSGLFIWNLPVEEWLFFVVIPYCVVFSYEVIRYFLPRLVFPKAALWVSVGSGLLFISMALWHTQKDYTFVVMMVAGILSLMQAFFRSHKTWLSHYYVTYLVTLIPFAVVNGVLTSLPVVRYNDMENLGVRLFSIPVEDTVYLMGMMLIVFTVYEKLKSVRTSQRTG